MIQSNTLFDDQRTSFADAYAQTISNLNYYGKEYRHWAIAFSGGKDSTAVVTLVAAMLAKKEIPQPESLTVIYADTRLELPPLQAGAMGVLAECRNQGFKTMVVYPEMDRRFMVYICGLGVPPPHNRFRWCTDQMKIAPMQRALQSHRDAVGEKFLMLTGVRLGESSARDARIALSCGLDGAECGQGRMQASTPESVADTLDPILHWRVCFVWDWLWLLNREAGFDTSLLAEVYGGDEAKEINARTGCIECPLTSRDVALEYLCSKEKWRYFSPLLELKPLWEELRAPHYRLRKRGETRKDGSPAANQGRMGPLTFDARKYALERVLDIQGRVNAAADQQGMPRIDLLNEEEHTRIRELWDAQAWPQGWDGTEERADTLHEWEYERGGNQQGNLLAFMASQKDKS